MSFSRRDLIKLGLSAIPAVALNRSSTAFGAVVPDSRFGGVQVGVIAPYSFRGLGNNPEELLKRIVELRLNAEELQSEAIELEYRTPEGSDTMTELRKCVQFCRNTLS